MPIDNDHPLAASLAWVATVDGQFVPELGVLDASWFPAAALFGESSPLLAEGLARAIKNYPSAERRVAGAFFIGNYTWYLAGAAVACYLAERCVPDLATANVAWSFQTYTWRWGGESGEAEQLKLRLLSGRFATLHSDPAAEHPDALVLPRAYDLKHWLREQLEQHLAPLIEAICQHTHFGRRGQWNIVADTIARLFQHLGEKLNVSEHAIAEGLSLVQAVGSPLRAANTNYTTVEYQGHCETFVRRGGCCLFYKINSDTKCSTCVLYSEEERNRRLLAYMAQKYA